MLSVRLLLIFFKETVGTITIELWKVYAGTGLHLGVVNNKVVQVFLHPSGSLLTHCDSLCKLALDVHNDLAF